MKHFRNTRVCESLNVITPTPSEGDRPSCRPFNNGKDKNVRRALLVAALTTLITVAVNNFTPLPARTVSAQQVERTETARAKESVGDYYETVVSVPVKSGIFLYANLNESEQVPYGPNSLSITKEGSFVVGDQVDNSVTELSRTGEVVNKARFSDAVAITDAVKVGGDFYALDRNIDRPAVLSSGGYQVATAPAGALRFSVAKDARLAYDLNVTKADGRDVKAIGWSKVSRDDGLKVSPGDPFADGAKNLKVWRGNNQIVEWRADYPIAETRLLGSTEKGDFFVVVFELVSQHAIMLDEQILHFSAKGKLLNQARVPQEQAMPLINDTALSADGDVFALIPRQDRLDIVKLKFKDRLVPLTIAEEGSRGTSKVGKTEEMSVQASASAAMPSVTRQQIASVANWYFNSLTSVSQKSINGDCNRHTPSYYKGGAKNYPSVPYSWGMADTPADFSNKMKQNQTAGHVADQYATPPYSNCKYNPAGTDCSGFVAQTWGMPGHPFGTSTVIGSGYAYQIDWSQLRQGDALVWQGHHIALFVSQDATGVNTWEATGDYGAERALPYHRTWKELNSYLPIRYKGLAITQPSARMTASSNRGIVYEYSTAVYTVSPGQSIYFTFDSSRSSANAGSIDGRTWNINGTTVSSAQSFGYSLGRGTHNVSLTVTNTDGGVSTSAQQIVINEVQIVPPPRVFSITPSTIKSQTSIWLHVLGSGFVQGVRAQVRTPAGGPWQIASSGVSYVNSGELWVSVWMGYGSYNATLELVNPSGVIAAGQFTVRP